MLVFTGFLAQRQIHRHRADHIHVVLLPGFGHLRQLIGIHRTLDLGVDGFGAADAGGMDALITQLVQHAGSIVQNLHLFVKIGEGVHAAVRHEDHLVITGGLEEHHVAQQAVGAQVGLFCQHGPHQIGGTQQTLHQKAGLTLGDQLHGSLGAVHIGIGGNNAVIGRVLPHINQHFFNLIGMTHQNRGDNTLFLGGGHSLNDGSIMGSSYRYYTGSAGFCRLNDGIQRIQSHKAPPFRTSEPALHRGAPAKHPVPATASHFHREGS